MRKTFLVIACLIVCNMAAQESKNSPEFSLNIGYDFGLKDGAGGMFSFQPELGMHFNEQFYLGIGTGVSTDDGFNALGIPAFLRAEVDFPGRKITPYISLQGGYDFNVSGGSSYARISPSVGIRMPMARNTDFKLGFGYTRTVVDGGGGDFLGIKAGFCFNTAGKGFARAMSNFFKSLDYSAEIETMLPVSEESEEYGGYTYREKYTYTSFMAVRFSALAPMPVKNLYAGLNVGVGFCKEKYEFWVGDDKTSDDKSNEICVYATARVKYKARQLAISDRIYPFALVDVGLGGYNNFVISPSAGISIKTGEEHSIDVSAGYTKCKGEGTLRIALGYTF